MLRYQTSLLRFFSNLELKNAGLFSDQVKNELQSFSDVELGDIFFITAFLSTAMEFLKEEHWLQKKQNNLPETFKSFINPIFKSELSTISFLENYFEASSLVESAVVKKKAQLIETLTIDLIKSRTPGEQKSFLVQALSRMAVLFEQEISLNSDKKAQGLQLGLTFYRTFDRLDEVLGLNYDSEVGMTQSSHHEERLYMGGGVNVQSGYSTILTALQNLNLQPGNRIIDLGCGFGRVGFVVGLLRPDVDFKGYEFVKNRVDLAQHSSQRLGLEKHVNFFTCDLSDRNFHIPDAEVYYMYDPFNEDTYKYVLSQLVSVSRQHKITIVTKGNARAPLLEVAKREGWPPPREFDNTNLCLFES